MISFREARRAFDAGLLATEIPAGRVVLALAFGAAPVAAVRFLGADTATARRVTWLTRMLAVRDGALGVGGLVARRRGADAAPWLVAGAAADALDAVVMAGAVRDGRLRGAVPAACVPVAAVTAALGIRSALRLRRQ